MARILHLPGSVRNGRPAWPLSAANDDCVGEPDTRCADAVLSLIGEHLLVAGISFAAGVFSVVIPAVLIGMTL